MNYKCINNRDLKDVCCMVAVLLVKEYGNIRTETFIQQARNSKMLDYEGINKIVKMISIAVPTHPWNVMRSAELLKLIDDSAYHRFVINKY